uniref:Reelin domain-containing protein n=1 Tax=Lepisosteus oculatus TaxID=7918 RepID=W5M426_LEPOC
AVCLALLLLGSSVHLGVMGFSTGSPPSLCDPMRLWHNSTSAQTTAAPYTVTAYPATYKPGDQITVSLRGSPDSFQGFLLQAQEVGGNDSVGSFTVTDSATSRLIACGGMMNSTVTQASDSMKTLVVVTWTAPTSGSLGDIEFRATFVKVLGVFWEDKLEMNNVPLPIYQKHHVAPLPTSFFSTTPPSTAVHSTTIGNFTGSITSDGCQQTKTCLAVPKGCDPANMGNCLFVSTAYLPDQADDIFFELQGLSGGYIAAILSADNQTVRAPPELVLSWLSW